MLNQYFRTPFANGGDKTAIPEATQPDGSVSYTQGYGPDYELPYSNASSKDVPRDQTNQLSFAITKALQEYQQNGVPDWIDPTQNGGVNFAYPKGARVRYSDGNIYLSLKAANSSLPTVAGDWTLETGRLMRTLIYVRVAGVQNVIVDGAAATTTGATTFTSAGGSFVEVEAIGAGGGSGGCPATSASTQAFSSGASGGAFGKGRYAGPLSSIAVTVGAAGAAGGLNTAGGNGGASSFGALLSVGGGTASPAGLPNSGSGATSIIAGASAISGANMLSCNGGDSGQSVSSGLGFVGGGFAGLSGLGFPAGYGAGGPGKYAPVSSAANVAGNAGQAGVVIVREYY